MKIWEFFDNLNELVYVSDIDTHEVVYMNKKALENYGYSFVEEVKGKMCYELIQNCQTPCSICNNSRLKEGEFIEWKYFNPVLKKHYMLKDTMIKEDGRRYRMEIALDVTAQEKQRDMIHNYRDMESLVNEGIKLALQAPNPDKTIDVILEYLGKALNGERTYIFEKRENGCDDNTYEWVAHGVTPEKDNLQNVPPEACENWYESFKKQENVIIGDIEDIKDENFLQYEILKQQNIHSIVVVPLYDTKKVIGFYGVDNPPGGFLNYCSDLLEIMGHFIISSLRRRNLLKQLKDLSYKDQLTKIGNRHAMNEFIDNLPKNKTLGVVYCDVTGLKKVNDTEGHEAGDRYILKACDSLKNAFGEYNLFRIGGDEFLGLCLGISEDLLAEKTDYLRKNMEENEVVLAIGTVWCEEGNKDIDKLISIAEKLMYEDKLRYYEETGIEKRLI